MFSWKWTDHNPAALCVVLAILLASPVLARDQAIFFQAELFDGQQLADGPVAVEFRL